MARAAGVLEATMDHTDRCSRSFTWLNITQFLGALNDNVFKLLVIFFLVEFLDLDSKTTIAAASAIFVIPFLLFSHAAGVLADRLSKRDIIVGAKVLEVVVMVLGCAGIYFAQPWVLFGLIFVMCTQSALFGPSKYGIIPELVGRRALSKANSYLVGLTYLAIILGTFLPSLMLVVLFRDNYIGLAALCVVVAVAGALASLRIERTPAAGGTRRFTPLFVLDTFRSLNRMRADRYLFAAVVGAAYFLFLGAFIQQDILIYGDEILGLGVKESGFLFPIAALGIGLGALLAGRSSGRNIEFGLVPIGAAGLSLCCLLLGMPGIGLVTVLALIFFIGISSGLFIVPLNAFIQYRAPADRRGEVLGAQNFLSFLGVAIAAALFFLLTGKLGLDSDLCFIIVGLLTAVLATVTVIMLPDFLIRFIILVLTRTIYRIRVRGLEHVPTEGPALLTPNHVSRVDALLLAAVFQRRIRFIMARAIYENRWMKPLYRLMGAIPIAADDPPRRIVAALKAARAALDEGYMVCIFPEGGITRNGNMLSFKGGMMRIVKGTHVPIIPVHIDGAWGSIFSYYHGPLLSSFPSRIPYPIMLTFGEPLPSDTTPEQLRLTISELAGDAFEARKVPGRNLGRQFVRTARARWFRIAIEDSTGQRLSFGRTLISAIAIGRALQRLTGEEAHVGIVLPASAAGALANVALTLQGKVPVNLNFTAAPAALAAAVQRCDIRTIISSRAFVEKLPDLVLPAGTVFMEDLVKQVTGLDRLVATAAALLASPRQLATHRLAGPDDIATIIFSSGSTGDPKGVMLSHHNILSNLESFLMALHFQGSDKMCAILPFFHSFGYTCTLWCPLVRGFSVFFHPNPLESETVGKLVHEHGLTILLVTPTFLLSYIRKVAPEHFASLRIVFAGAEKLRQRVADTFEKRFGIRPFEGYGATELSPVGAINLPDVTFDGVSQTGTKPDSIGHPIPGLAARIVDLDTGAWLPPGERGMLQIKGPNVMRGYLADPRRTGDVLKEGWYVTGDIARIDDDGFVFLLDRLSRFSKIGGEMIPHMAIEEVFAEAVHSNSQTIFVTAAPDEKRGEQLVVIHTAAAGDTEALQQVVRDCDLPNLWKPRRENYLVVESFATLGSGKLDQRRLKDIACEFVQRRPKGIAKAISKIRDTI